jgi:hypothetical protein
VSPPPLPDPLAHAPIPRLPHLEDPHISARRFGSSALPLPLSPTATAPNDVFIFRDVLEELFYRGLYEPTSGSFLTLTGGWYVGPFGPYVEIEGFRDAVHAPSTLGLLDYLTDHRALWPSPPKHDPPIALGGCLIAPRGGALFGPDEVLLCNSLLTRPCHVLLIIDPVGDRFAFYGRDPHGRFLNLAFWLLDDLQPA